MVARKITEAEVESTLTAYHTLYQDRKGNDIYIGHPDGRRIKVVIAKGSNPRLVITTGD